eukprot:341641_1
MKDDMLKHFIFDQTEHKEIETKVLFFAMDYNFDTIEINKKFQCALKSYENNKHVNDEIKQRLCQGLELMISTIKTKDDRLGKINIGTLVAASPLHIAGGLIVAT